MHLSVATDVCRRRRIYTSPYLTSFEIHPRLSLTLLALFIGDGSAKYPSTSDNHSPDKGAYL